MKNKKITKIVLIVSLLIVILVVVFLINNNINDKKSLTKLKKYSENLTEFNCQEAILDRGYISKDDALKIIATSTVSRNDTQIQMKEYLKSVDSIKIEFIENNESKSNNSTFDPLLDISSTGDIESEGSYWHIRLKKHISSYFEEAQFNVDYYTGKILYGEVTLQLNS